MTTIMSRNQCIYHVYIADGFADDCDELIHRCMQVNTLSYEKFCDVWRDMKLASIFHGRGSSAELAELSEEVLHIAKHYMVANTSNYEESVAGLFLVYSLLNLQPLKNFASLRLIDEDVPAIERIEAVARRARRYDVLHILGTVLIKGPTQYHVAARERGLEQPLRKYLEGHSTIDKQGIRPKGVFFRQNEELDILRELNRLGKLYKQSKLDISGTNKIDRSLCYVNDNLTTELESSLKKVITGIIDDEDADEISPQSEHNTAQSIKERAMKTTVKPIKHLTGINERNTETLSPEEKSKQNKSPKNIVRVQSKTSPKQHDSSSKKNQPLVKNILSLKVASPVTTDMPSLTQKSAPNNLAESPKKTTSPKKKQPLKRKGPNDLSPKKKRSRKEKVIFTSSDEDDDDISLPESDEMSDISDESISDGEQEQTKHELDIQIDSLPIIIRSEEEGVYYEIEIIDNYDKNAATSPKTGRAVVEPVTTGNCELPNRIFDDASISKAEDPSTSVAEIMETTDMAEISKVNEMEAADETEQYTALKKRDKRDLKRTKLKTKFQRMGLLSVANFKEEVSKSNK